MQESNPGRVNPQSDPNSESRKCVTRMREGDVPDNVPLANELLDVQRSFTHVQSAVTIAPDIIVEKQR